MCICPGLCIWPKSYREAYNNAQDIQAARAAAARNYLANQDGARDGAPANRAHDTPYKNNANMIYAGAGVGNGDDGISGTDAGGFGLSSAAGFGGASFAGDGGMSTSGGFSGGDGGMSSGGGMSSSGAGGGGMSSAAC